MFRILEQILIETEEEVARRTKQSEEQTDKMEKVILGPARLAGITTTQTALPETGHSVLGREKAERAPFAVVCLFELLI